MARKYPLADVKVLYSRAGGRCSFPDCRLDLVIEAKKEGKTKQIGLIGHIIAHSDKGPRTDSSYPPEKLDTYENWILLCGTHHDVIDTIESEYPVEDVRKMKKNHEEWVQESLEKQIINIGFAELEVAATAISSANAMLTKSSFDLLPPAEKIEKNNLTESTYNLITMGISRSREVGKYIESQSKLDEDYPERLKKGFREEYDRLVDSGITGDELFESMYDFSSSYNYDSKSRASGLAILTHLFELCEVFEK